MKKNMLSYQFYVISITKNDKKPVLLIKKFKSLPNHKISLNYPEAILKRLNIINNYRQYIL